MKSFLLPFLFFLSFPLFAQIEISGIVINTANSPIEGANVYLEGTYNGGTTNAKGQFTFTTSEIGKQLLIVSFLSYETHFLEGNTSSFQNLKIVLQEERLFFYRIG